jgi:hypothetical protein
MTAQRRQKKLVFSVAISYAIQYAKRKVRITAAQLISSSLCHSISQNMRVKSRQKRAYPSFHFFRDLLGMGVGSIEPTDVT